MKSYDPEIIRHFVERVRVYPAGEIKVELRTSSGLAFLTANESKEHPLLEAAKMFTVAGPVIVYGVSVSVIYGIILMLLQVF